jgi:hypothetical protein
MKKIMLALIVLVSLTKVASAQKGSILLYGNVGFGSATDSFGFKSSSYTINPGVGLQLSDNWTVGLNFAFGGSSEDATGAPNPTTPNVNNTTTTFFNIGPFLRYTYAINTIFSIYGQANISYLSGTKDIPAVPSGSYTGFGTELFPAIGVNLKHGFALNLSFGGLAYQTKTYKGGTYNSSTDIAPTSSTSQFAITLGQGATFGISKNFGGTAKK